MNDTLLEMIRKARKAKPRVIVAADGMSASGKTTWAEAFTAQQGFALVSIDRFFPAPGGPIFDAAIDFSRVLNEVILPFERGETIRYRPFSCQKQVWEDEITVPDSDVLVLEGVYSTHPLLSGHEDIRLFFRIGDDEQKRRILARNGEYYLERFTNEWIPNEKRYFARYRIPEQADLLYE